MKWLIVATVAFVTFVANKTAQRVEVVHKKGPVTTWCEFLESHEIKFPMVALAQATWETNFFTSKIDSLNKNMFGMKHNRRGFSKGVQYGHALYLRDIDSIKDYAAWQRNMLRLRPDVDTEEEYIQMLDSLPICKGCRYAEDRTYTQKIRNRIEELKNMD